MNKKRILCVTEAHFLATGYSVYTKELLTRLYETGKYEIAELACYCEIRDERIQAPWTVYSNAPNKDNPQEVSVYQSDIKNEFGRWRFNQVVLDFRPDIVISFRDTWMDDFISTSPLRSLYKWAWMATVDSAPQDEAWLEQFLNADAVFYYSDWGKEIVEKQAGKQLKSRCAVPPSVEKDLFKPSDDKDKMKAALGLGNNPFIIGTVMRNQKRKLFPDLIESFRQYLDKCKASGNEDLYNRSYLYLHTTYPDIGWDLPELIREHGVADKTLFTYRCLKCNNVGVSFFNGARGFCPKCNTFAYGLPTTQMGVSRPALAYIYNLFDVFVQYSIAEGLGMPQVEAAFCNVPIMSVDYSAMSDVVKKVNGYPIAVKRMFREAETNAYRAYPDNEDLVNKLYKFATLPTALRQRKGFEAFRGANKHYSWERTSEAWQKYFDEEKVDDKHLDNLLPVNQQVPQNLTNSEFVKWCYINLLGQPQKIGSYTYLRRVKWLNYGAKVEARGGLVLPDDSVLAGRQFWSDYNREQCAQDCLNERQEREHWINLAKNYKREDAPYYIKMAVNRN